jgi:hypothetical protein
MDALCHVVIRSLHLGDLRQHGFFPRCPVAVHARFGLSLFGGLPHRRPFLVRPHVLTAHGRARD